MCKNEQKRVSRGVTFPHYNLINVRKGKPRLTLFSVHFHILRARNNKPTKKKPQERKTASHQERKSNWLAVFLSCGFFLVLFYFARARHYLKRPFQ